MIAAAVNAIAVLDVQQLETAAGDPVLGYIPERPGAGVFDVAVSLDDRFVFATDERAARVTVADLAAARRGPFNGDVIVGHVPQGGGPTGIALSPDGRRLYVTDQIAPSNIPGAARCNEDSVRGERYPEGALVVIDVDRATQGAPTPSPPSCPPAAIQ